jgi:NAD+-dependent secondary alcohol dehydrogenase Adh1
LQPGSWVAVLGVGGLGHIGLQCLHELTAANVIAVDPSPTAQELAGELGARYMVGAEPVDAVRELTGGGAHVVVDFVGEKTVQQQAIAMLRQGGTHIVVGYGDVLQVPTIDLIFSEISIVGSLVGNYTELSELMMLHAEGRVTLRTQRYKLDEINRALDDLDQGRIKGRGVLVP